MTKNGFLYAELKKNNIPIIHFSYVRKKRYYGKSTYNYLKLFFLGFNWIRNYI